MAENPCLTCGACCAFFRVSFYWAEADPAQGGTIPPELVEDVTSFTRCMQGTNQKHPRCVALKGEVGRTVTCSIYAERSTACREFGIDWDSGVLRYDPADLARCTQARAAWGLPSLIEHPPPKHYKTRRWIAYAMRYKYGGPGSHPARRRRSPAA